MLIIIILAQIILSLDYKFNNKIKFQKLINSIKKLQKTHYQNNQLIVSKKEINEIIIFITCFLKFP